MIIDSQVHLNLIGQAQGLTAMDAIGIDAVIIDEFAGFDDRGRALPADELPGGAFRPSLSFAEHATAAHPTRFAFVARPQPDDPDLTTLMADMAANPSCLALRIIPYVPSPPWAPDLDANVRATIPYFEALLAGTYDPMLRLAQSHALPVFLQISGVELPARLDVAEALARRFPELQLVVDHCGVRLPGTRGELTASDDEELARLLKLASFDNIAVKWSHALRLSAEDFPYEDLTPRLHAVLGAFGAGRLMWGSDWIPEMSPYSWSESLFQLRAAGLAEDELNAVLGDTAGRLLSWLVPATAEGAM